MKLSADLLKGVVKVCRGEKPTPMKLGSVHYLPEGIYRVVGKVSSIGGDIIHLSNGRSILAGREEELPILKDWEIRLSNLIKYAAGFQTDFTEYVNSVLEDKGLPTDPSMSWTAWLYTVTSGYQKEYGEEAVEEAIHNLLVTILIEKNVISKFDEEKMSGSSLEKKLTSFIKQHIKWGFRDILERYLRSYRPSELELKEEITPSEGQWGSPLDLALEAQENTQFSHFRREFIDWMVSEKNGLQVRNQLPIRILFDLILLSDGKRVRTPELADQFEKLTHKSAMTIPHLLKKLGDLLMEFSKDTPSTITFIPLVQKLRSLSRLNLK